MTWQMVAKDGLTLKPYLIGPVERHDNTLKFWIEAYFAAA